ncbi:MAG: nitronate monooxygenase [Gammaproteobacteria bacterium]
MNNRLCEMFGIDVPIFAFSHCRDVVVEVSRAGGMGVLGMGRMSPRRLREELRWIDDHIGGRPYGIDVLMPSTYSEAGELKFDMERLVPREHVEFVRGLLDAAGIPPLPTEERDAIVHNLLSELSFTPEESMAMVDIAMEHPIKLIVNALGSPPASLVEAAHARGIKVAAMAGKAKHAQKHKERGCDFVIAVGGEAGGHTGTISSMVLWPEVVDAVAPLPVLGAGGVARGRQVAAALALGCEGVWCGSVWLPSAQSELMPEIKQRLLEASAEDSVHTRAVTGKPCRTLRSAFTDAYERPGAPTPLPAPLQNLLWWAEGRTRVERVRAREWLTYPVGQVVGSLTTTTSVRDIVYGMMEEMLVARERLNDMFD